MNDRDIQALLGFAHAATGLPAPTPVEVEAWCAFDSLHALTLAEAKAAVIDCVESHKGRGARWTVSIDQVLHAARHARAVALAHRHPPTPPVDPDDELAYRRWLREWVAAAGRGLSDAEATSTADAVCGTSTPTLELTSGPLPVDTIADATRLPGGPSW